MDEQRSEWYIALVAQVREHERISSLPVQILRWVKSATDPSQPRGSSAWSCGIGAASAQAWLPGLLKTHLLMSLPFPICLSFKYFHPGLKSHILIQRCTAGPSEKLSRFLKSNLIQMWSFTGVHVLGLVKLHWFPLSKTCPLGWLKAKWTGGETVSGRRVFSLLR